MTNEDKTRLLESISSLAAELETAKRDLSEASMQRAFAEEAENQLIAEVESLTKLIEIRRKRLGPHAGDPSGANKDQAKLALEMPSQEPPARSAEDAILLEIPEEDSPEASVNKTAWIFNFVVGRGSRGVLPPEVFRAAANAGVSMHPNYPYTVLRKFVDKQMIVKRRGRYYKKPA
jgi:hypothetical protein